MIIKYFIYLVVHLILDLRLCNFALSLPIIDGETEVQRGTLWLREFNNLLRSDRASKWQS